MSPYFRLGAYDVDVIPDAWWVGRAKKAAKSLSSKRKSKNSPKLAYVYVVLLYYPKHKKIGLYVGETQFKPAERLQNHKKGIHANKDVKKYGRRLMPEIGIVRLNELVSVYPQTKKGQAAQS